MDEWSIEDFNNYMSFYTKKLESLKKKSRPGKTYTEKNLDQLFN